MEHRHQSFWRFSIDQSVVLGILLLITATTAIAEPPMVVVDIPPAHSLVARVMDGVGTPALILSPGASPHSYAMRPSEARLLNEAEIVFWVGENLTPWLDRAIENLSGDSVVVELLGVDGVRLLNYRQGATFTTHNQANDAHDYEDADPHAWLDPENGSAWLDAIATTLSEVDPENASTYFQNAVDGKDELDVLITELSEMLEPILGRPFVVLHDAYQYFEARFGIKAAGAISFGDASDPGPARLLEVRDTIDRLGVLCVFVEPLYKLDLVSTVIEETRSKTGTLDLMGANLEPGRDLYPRLLENLVEELVSCLK